MTEPDVILKKWLKELEGVSDQMLGEECCLFAFATALLNPLSPLSSFSSRLY